MVIVEVPVVAVAVAENETVTIQVGLHGLFVKMAVTPVGRPDAEKVTAAVVPLTSVASIDDEELVVPCITVKVFGEGVERLKSKAGAATVNDKVVEWLALPPATLIVTMAVPRVAVGVAENETVTVHVGLHGLLVKVAVTPLGSPAAEKVTGVVVPLTSVALIEED